MVLFQLVFYLWENEKLLGFFFSSSQAWLHQSLGSQQSQIFMISTKCIFMLCLWHKFLFTAFFPLNIPVIMFADMLTLSPCSHRTSTSTSFSQFRSTAAGTLRSLSSSTPSPYHPPHHNPGTDVEQEGPGVTSSIEVIPRVLSGVQVKCVCRLREVFLFKLDKMLPPQTLLCCYSFG